MHSTETVHIEMSVYAVSLSYASQTELLILLNAICPPALNLEPHTTYATPSP